MEQILNTVQFNDKGLVNVIVQDYKDNSVLMVAWMNRETLIETLEIKKMVYWSRSRQERWLKGETSGHFQEVKEVAIDCDGDAMLFKVDQLGAACHEGYRSCFFRVQEESNWAIHNEKVAKM